MPAEFVVPGANRASAALDVSRTVVRRAERLVVSAPVEGSLVGRYLNRLSDLLWAMARWSEGDEHVLARGDRSRRGGARSRSTTAKSATQESATAKSTTAKSATAKSATQEPKTEHEGEG
jgi:hypothetical protein